MKTFSVLPTICAGNSPVPGEFPTQRPVTRSFVYFDLRPNKRLSKQSWGWWFETLSCSLWRHRNAVEHFKFREKWKYISVFFRHPPILIRGSILRFFVEKNKNISHFAKSISWLPMIWRRLRRGHGRYDIDLCNHCMRKCDTFTAKI